MSALKDLADQADEAEAISELKRSNDSLLRQLDKAKASKADLVDAVYRAAKEAASALEVPPVPRPAPQQKRGKPEIAVAIISDWQLGKVTPTYSSEICAQRIERFADKITRLVSIQRADHPVRELHIWNLGDLVEGELVFPGQAHRIDASLFRQVSVDGPRILSGFQRRMLALFERVHQRDVDGNHSIGGSDRREFHPETTADRMVIAATRLITGAEKRLHWPDPDPRGERNWYAVDTIGAYSCLLVHGDQIKGGFAGFPWYGADRKVGKWFQGAVPEHFDDVAIGHFHTPLWWQMSERVHLWANGTTESSNTYAAERLAGSGRPMQWLLFIEPVKGHVTAHYPVWLDE
jgi:hypothetical protein